MRFGNLFLAGALLVKGQSADDYADYDADKICDYPIDVMLLQDTTGSFMDDMPYTRAQLPKLIELIGKMFPNSRTGIAEFRDKPYFPLGETTDFCYKKNEYGALSFHPGNTEWALSILQPSGGGDIPEDHYQAAVSITLDPSVTWRPIVSSNDALSTKIRQQVAAAAAVQSSESNSTLIEKMMDALTSPLYVIDNPPLQPGDEVAARVIVIITDANPHYNGQMALYKPNPKYPEWKVPQGLPANTGDILNGNLSYPCVEMDYLKPEVFKQVVIDTNKMTVLILHTPDMESVWSWVNDVLLTQPASYRQTIDELSSNLLPQLLKAIQSVASYACNGLTTTAPPATTVATTAAPETTVAPTAAPETTPAAETTTAVPTAAPETTVAPTAAPETTVAPTAAPETTIAPTAAPETTVAPTAAPETTVAPTAAPETTPAAETTTAAPTAAPETTTAAPTAAPATTAVPTASPEPCPPGCAPDCAPGCDDGVFIRLKEKPRHMILEIFNDDVPPATL